MRFYVEDNFIPFIEATLVAIIFFIFTIIFLKSYLRTKSHITFSYLMATLMITINWSSYAYRCAFFPSETSWHILKYFWFLSYAPGGLSMFFFAQASLLFTKKSGRTYERLLPFLMAMIIFGIFLLSIATIEISDLLPLKLTEYGGVKDIEFPLLLTIYFAIYMLIMLSIANVAFIYFLKKADKNLFAYTRVKWLESGLVLISAGYIIEGLKINFIFLIFIGRVFISIGGFLMLHGLRLKDKNP